MKSKLKKKDGSAWTFKNILTLLLLIAAAGTILRLPRFLDTLQDQFFYFRSQALVFIMPIIVYFVRRTNSVRFIGAVLLISAGAITYLFILPDPIPYFTSEAFGAFNDALFNAELHIPLFLWLLAGVAYAGKNWKEPSARMGFLRYNGELIIYATILAIGGTILYIITLYLLDVIKQASELSRWYRIYVSYYGIVSIPIIATFLLDKVIDKRLNIAPTIARIFTPLFLITTIAYLIIMVVYQNNPFSNREYLIVLNILLIVILGLLIFTIAERNPISPPGTSDYLNFGLALAIIILNIIALSATLFRSTSDVYGLTPNRISIFGMNLLVFIHLIGILYHYLGFIRYGKSFKKVEIWIAGYLPIYAIWAIFVSVALPLFFWYK